MDYKKSVFVTKIFNQLKQILGIIDTITEGKLVVQESTLTVMVQ